jgi:predicted phosphohydrolase
MSIHKIAWLTDIHLNFLKNDKRRQFYQSIVDTDANAILITGDIAEANDICEILSELSVHTNMPIYFVLGNHDYYSGSVASVREKILTLCTQNTNLTWLGKPGSITLNTHTVLVGHDGWADARYGDFDHSPVNLNDSRLIAELFQAFLLSKSALKNQMQKLADADAETLKQTLTKVTNSNYKKVIIATHVPPFPECSWHKDMPNDNNWLPYFASKAIGDIITDAAQKHPEIEFQVLCGHTHTRSIARIVSNLEVRAGAAEYYHPIIQEIIEV